MEAEWKTSIPYRPAPPERERRAREALELAAASGIPQGEIDAVFIAHVGQAVKAWDLMTDEQLANLSASLRVLSGFY